MLQQGKDMGQSLKIYSNLLTDFVAESRKRFGDSISSIVLYGSVARGTARKDSDIDVCIFLKNLPQSRYKRTLLIFPLLKELRERESYMALYRDGYLPEISPLLYTNKEAQDTKPIFLDMVGEGVVLYDDGMWAAKRQTLMETMKLLGTKKVVLENNEYYWILKPGLRLAEEVVL